MNTPSGATTWQLFDARGLADLELHLDVAPHLDGSALVSTPQGAFTEVESSLDRAPTTGTSSSRWTRMIAPHCAPATA